MAPARDHFPPDYFQARARFLALAQARGAEAASYPLAARGPTGEPLSIDTAYFGAREPRRLLIVLSGTHGVEGFAGSALQQQWLDQYAPARLPPDSGCLLIHALNAYGFAWQRRANEGNVDLNRNALRRFPGPANPAYRHLDRWLNPPSPPPLLDFFWLHGAMLLARYGFGALQQAIVAGQYEYPRGLFYGGTRAEASTEILFGLLTDERWRQTERVVALDIHTGFGARGTYKLMVDFPPASAPYRELEQWFGPSAVASDRPAGSIAYRVVGGLTERLARCFPAAKVYAGVLEFGTVRPARALAALRRENRAYHHSASNSRERQAAAQALRQAFCPNDPLWRRRVLEHGEKVLRQAERACFSAGRDATGPAPARAG